MSSREHILSAVRKHLPQLSPLPDLNGPWITYPDPVAQFAGILEMIGGRCVRVPSLADVLPAVQSLPQFAAAPRVVCTLPELGIRSVDLNAIGDPHELEDVGFAILRGELGVAENAAVWVTDCAVAHRAIYFLCEHLALVIYAGQLVHNLHEAYQRIRLDGAQFGTFIAGPSKTADIEQSLVIGAHGPKSLTVFVIG